MRLFSRALSLAVALLVACAGFVTTAHGEPATPGAPDLSKYQLVSNEAYRAGDEVYFQTPGGLLCAIRSTQWAGCNGTLPGAPSGANEVLLSDNSERGYYQTSTPRFVRTSGGAAPVLHAGQKITLNDFECAVDAATTICTKDSPAAAWFTLSPDGADIGPATPGLPDGFPEPQDFVLAEQSYAVGSGPKNIVPMFTVANGLTCQMLMYSGGKIGCNGPLAGVDGGENQVSFDVPGTASIIKTDNPGFSTPTYPGPVQQLPAGYKVHAYSAESTCLATADGGVACYAGYNQQYSGFVASKTDTWTF
ncbi:MAG: hypothetical protein ACSLE6_14495 [Mycobacterium sp.]